MTGIKSYAMLANTAASVVVDAAPDLAYREKDLGVVSVVVSNGAADPIYVTTDGTVPTVRGDDCYPVLPDRNRKIPVAGRPESATVHFIGAGAGDVSVEAVSG